MSRAGPTVHLCWVRPLRRIGFQPQPVGSKQHLFENPSFFFWISEPFHDMLNLDQRILHIRSKNLFLFFLDQRIPEDTTAVGPFETSFTVLTGLFVVLVHMSHVACDGMQVLLLLLGANIST